MSRKGGCGDGANSRESIVDSVGNSVHVCWTICNTYSHNHLFGWNVAVEGCEEMDLWKVTLKTNRDIMATAVLDALTVKDGEQGKKGERRKGRTS